MPCHRKLIKIKETESEPIVWKSNWTSEFFLEAASNSIEVNECHYKIYIFITTKTTILHEIMKLRRLLNRKLIIMFFSSMRKWKCMTYGILSMDLVVSLDSYLVFQNVSSQCGHRRNWGRGGEGADGPL